MFWLIRCLVVRARNFTSVLGSTCRNPRQGVSIRVKCGEPGWFSNPLEVVRSMSTCVERRSALCGLRERHVVKHTSRVLISALVGRCRLTTFRVSSSVSFWIFASRQASSSILTKPARTASPQHSLCTLSPVMQLRLECWDYNVLHIILYPAFRGDLHIFGNLDARDRPPCVAPISSGRP